MKINNNYLTALQSRNKNQTHTNPAFKEHIIVHLKKIPENMVPDAVSGIEKIITPENIVSAAVSEIEKVIGKGFKEMSYKVGEETIPHNIFAGYSGDEVVISTGDSSSFDSKQLRAKLRQIDIHIYKKIRQALKALKIKNLDGDVITGDCITKTTGGIENLNNGNVLVRIEKSFEKCPSGVLPDYYLYYKNGELAQKIPSTENVLTFSKSK